MMRLVFKLILVFGFFKLSAILTLIGGECNLTSMILKTAEVKREKEQKIEEKI